MNEPRVYKSSPILFVFMLFIFGVLFVGLVAAMGRETWYILLPFGAVFVLLFLAAIVSMTSQTTISDEEISTKNLFGTKTLRWSEINQVSGTGHSIKLHDIDRGITVTPNPQLPGYPEIIDWIGAKRPDLFSPGEYAQMSRSWLQPISYILFGMIFIGIGIFAYMQESDTFFPFLMVSLLGLGFIGMALLAPQSLSIQGDTLVIHYFFSEKTLPRNEVASVDMRFTQTRNGKHYFTTLNLTNRKSIRISGFRPNLPVVHLVLKNWHKANTSLVRQI
jgi:hypothetical protein